MPHNSHYCNVKKKKNIYTYIYIYIHSVYIENEMKSRHVSKKVDMFFQRTCSCLLDTWKKNIEIPGFPSLLFICTENFTYTNPFTFSHDRAAHFFWTCKMYIYYLLLHLFASLCPHTVCSQILNEPVFIYIFYCFCCQKQYEIWIWNSLKRDSLRLHNQLSLPRC